jgi:hypothetical protein
MPSDAGVSVLFWQLTPGGVSGVLTTSGTGWDDSGMEET